MNEEFTLSVGKRWLARLCFLIIGINSFSNPIDRLNPYYIGTGIVFGLLFGWLFQMFLKSFLNTFNWKYKKEGGKNGLKYAIENGLLYLIPYVVLMTLATFYFRWSLTLGFVSTGIMTAGASATMELGKIKGKQEIKNTIATTIVAFLFSTIWTLGIPYMMKIPSLLEGGITLVRSLMQGGGGL